MNEACVNHALASFDAVGLCIEISQKHSRLALNGLKLHSDGLEELASEILRIRIMRGSLPSIVHYAIKGLPWAKTDEIVGHSATSLEPSELITGGGNSSKRPGPFGKNANSTGRPLGIRATRRKHATPALLPELTE